AGPQLLDRRCGGSGGDQAAAAAVQHGDVPGPEVVAVVAVLRIPGGGAEVAEVPGRVGRLVIPFTGRRLGARFVQSPARLVALLVLRERAVVVGGVAGCEHGARDAVEQGGGRRRAGYAALGDVPRADQRGGALRRGQAGRWRRRALRGRPGGLTVAAGGEHDAGREHSEGGKRP